MMIVNFILKCSAPPYSTFFFSVCRIVSQHKREKEEKWQKMFIASESGFRSWFHSFSLLRCRVPRRPQLCTDMTLITFAMHCRQRICYSVAICLDIDAFTPTQKFNSMSCLREQYRPNAEAFALLEHLKCI